MIVLYAIDLFCGAGGMSEGILQAGFHILFSNDISEDAAKTYVNRHHQLGLIQGYNTYFHRADIRDLNGNFINQCIRDLDIFNNGELNLPRDIDAIFGGPPCQGFSRAGRRQADDPRNMLFKEYVRIINEINPKYVVMENVEGFLDTKLENFEGLNGNIYEGQVYVKDILINELNNIEYNVLEPRLLDASDYGVPQKRKRAIFIAYRNDVSEPRYPDATHIDNKVSIKDAISDLILNDKLRGDFNQNQSEYQRESINGRTRTIDGRNVRYNGLMNYEMSKHTPAIVERFSLYNEGEDTSQLKSRILKLGIDLEMKPNLLKLLEKKLNKDRNQIIEKFRNANVEKEEVDILLTKKSIRKRLNHLEQSATVVTLPDDMISPFENRIFSVREMARLQSFDDSFEFLGKRTTGGDKRKSETPQYTQVGNAVPPLLAKAIASEIRNAIIRTNENLQVG